MIMKCVSKDLPLDVGSADELYAQLDIQLAPRPIRGDGRQVQPPCQSQASPIAERQRPNTGGRPQRGSRQCIDCREWFDVYAKRLEPTQCAVRVRPVLGDL